MAAIKVLLIAGLLMFSSPVTTYALGKSAMNDNVRPLLGHNPVQSKEEGSPQA